MSAIILRVIPEDFEVWRAAHESCRAARAGYGVTAEHLYRDVADPGVALVQLDTDDVARTLRWFGSPEFRRAAAGVTVGERSMLVAEPGP
jgi:hypothetical protein